MVQMVVFVNLFFVPTVCLYLIYRKKERPIVKSLELLFQYCIVSACNIPAAKVFIFLIKKFTGTQISIDSGYYTLAALISALLLAWFYLNVRIEIKTERVELGSVEAAKDEEM